MSGRQLQKPTDASKFRQQYLANLALQAKNNDVNLQANKLYQRTGQLPVPPTDTRTTAEKYADILRLKLELRQGLAEIMDGVNTERVVNQLDQNELLYLSNRLPEVVKILKPKYRNGILATPFMVFLRRYEADELRNDGVRTGLQQDAGRDVLLGIRQILDNMVDRNDLMMLEDVLRGETGKLSQQILQEIDNLITVIPSEEVIMNMNRIRDQQAQEEVRELINNALEDVPTKQELSQLIQDFQIAQNKRDRAQMGVVLGQLREILQVQREQKEQMRLAEEIIRTSAKGGEDLPEVEAINPEEKAPVEAEAESVPEKITKIEEAMMDRVEREGYIPVNQLDALKIDNLKAYARFMYQNEHNGNRNPFPPDIKYSAKGGLAKINKAPLIQILRDNDEAIQKYWGATKQGGEKQGGEKKKKETKQPKLVMVGNDEGGIDVDASAKQLARSKTPEDIQNLYMSLTEERKVKYEEVFAKALRIALGLNDEGEMEEAVSRGERKAKEEGKGLRRKMKGRGLAKKQNKEPFGDVLIHKPKLENDIISVRKSNGSSVFKSKLVSNKLGNVVRTIHGGKMPSYDDYKDLSEDEKVYLHKLVKASGLMDKLNIPSPNKDEEDRDKNEFEIARGEILSGNDSPALIKKFKTLIIKMMKRELISNSEGKELLFEIIALGH